MRAPLQWLKKHGYEAHLMAFCLMTLPPVLLYYSVRRDLDSMTWGLLGVVILGNLIALWVK